MLSRQTTSSHPDAAEPGGKRRNRDCEARQAGAAQGLQPEFTQADEMTLQQVLDDGQWGLRFPEPWESRFQEDCEPARVKLLLACAVIGIAGFWFGSANNAQLAPDLGQAALGYRIPLLTLMCSTLGFLLLVRLWRRRAWYYDAGIAVNCVAAAAGLVWLGMHSQALPATAHAAVLCSNILFTGVAARLRFRWMLGTVSIVLGSYALLVKGQSPEQSLYVEANVQLMVVAMVCTLIANYFFEYTERRLWLLRLQGQAHRDALAMTRQTLNELSMRDALTGLYNRRQFDAELARAWREAGASGQQVALLMLDIDHFKTYNDTYGHLAGDACLQEVAKVLAQAARETAGAMAARLGGEEFAVLLPGHGAGFACEVAERICGDIRRAGIEHRASATAPHVTASLGVAAVHPGAQHPPPELFERADRSLYRAKGSGRNRVLADDGTPVDTNGLANTAQAAPPPVEFATPGEAEQATLREAMDWRRLRWLHFPPAIESRYQSAIRIQRRWHLLAGSAGGLVLLTSLTYLSRNVAPDVVAASLELQMWMVPAMLLMILAADRLRMQRWMRELTYAGCAALVAVACALVMSRSHELSTLSHAKTLVLIPLVACVVARLPFWFACLPAVAAVAALGLLHAQDPTARLILRESVLVVSQGTVFALIAAYTLEWSERRAWLSSEIGRLQGEALEAATRSLRSLSTLDPLTGLSNRRHFEQIYDRLWKQAHEHAQPLSLLILDVDHFKLYNDGYGHAAGDACLQQLALILQGVAANEDVRVARLGGEEFGVLLARHDLTDALRVAESICAAVRNALIEHRYSRLARHLTVSIGAACREDADSTLAPRELLARADDALYQAKTQGRDRACGARRT